MSFKTLLKAEWHLSKRHLNVIQTSDERVAFDGTSIISRLVQGSNSKSGISFPFFLMRNIRTNDANVKPLSSRPPEK